VSKRGIVQEVSGFVPVFEVLLERYEDHITALVFGRRWQYCRMEDGVCRASLETIANDLKVSKATVMRHTELLVRDEYLIDLTPDARNVPHIYADAGKIIMKSQLTATVSERNTTVSQRKASVSQGNATVSESHLIKDSIKQNIKQEKEEEGRNPLFDLYQNNISMLTPRIADWLEEAEKTYTFEWVSEAITIAARNGAKSWNYCESILKRWKQEGKSERPGKKKSAAASDDPNRYIKGEYAHLIEH
jgi:DnaD/phage-associated family protein